MSRKIITSFVCCWLLVAASVYGQQIVLFEKNNLADWDFHVIDKDVKVEDVFSFAADGRLLCTGLPYGYLATKESYKNFKLTLEWRWPGEVTNSGIFLKITDMPANCFLPKSIEVQLRHKDVGDMYGFHGRTIRESADRLLVFENHPVIGNFMGVTKIRDAELLPPEWNTMEILCVDNLIVVVVNGRIVNWTTGAEAIAGQVGFQSEGGPIEFRNAVLTPLP